MAVVGIGSAAQVDPAASLVTALNAATAALTASTASSLQKSSNLSDVTSASTSRTNLGLDTTYVPLLQAATTYAYNADGTVASETSGGVTTTYGYTAGVVTSVVRGGVTRTITYNSDGTIASVA